MHLYVFNQESNDVFLLTNMAGANPTNDQSRKKIEDSRPSHNTRMNLLKSPDIRSDRAGGTKYAPASFCVSDWLVTFLQHTTLSLLQRQTII